MPGEVIEFAVNNNASTQLTFIIEVVSIPPTIITPTKTSAAILKAFGAVALALVAAVSL